MEKVITRTCEHYLDEYGILYLKMLKGSEMDLEDAIDNLVVAKSLAKHQPVLKLIDIREKRKVSKEARSFIRKTNIPEHHLAKALLVNSAIEKYFESFLQSLITSKFPVKIFTSEEEAITWLRSFQK